ncbi:MAG: L-seryl-tRNA(Sec) selenium transferase [Verrucomicrobia bacterium]|nr:L-seryl-tRNA(Sec) selenium transferase [Verrucomicrobiota bacterium]
MSHTESRLRSIPAVERILQALGETGLPRPVVVSLVRRELAGLRGGDKVPPLDEILAQIRGALDGLRLSRIQPVINGTGILVHTNLGRSPLGPEVVKTLAEMAANYNNLEYDLAGGERGGRAGYLERNLALLCEAEAATVVNNCAAALVLILRHLATGERNEVILSRGELVQIGGGFRIPEILEASGAQLREVGTTNKTSLKDYEQAVSPRSGLILKVHRSNFFMDGFVESPSTERIADLARKCELPFVEDLGSGAMVPTEQIPGVEHEPTPMEVLRRGVDLVCFSGDKLMGGPQAGVIAGKAKLVTAVKREPFFRALRCDKLILSALQTTVELYLAGAGEKSMTGAASVPVLQMLEVSNDELRLRGENIVAALAGLPLEAGVGDGNAQIGGGTLPRSVVPSVAVNLVPKSLALEKFAVRLRTAAPPVVGYISEGRFKLDLRTIFPRQDDEVVRAIRTALANRQPGEAG